MYRIKEICKNQGVQIKDLAKEVGIDKVTMSQIIGDRQNTSTSTLKKIASILNVSVKDLFINDRVSIKTKIADLKTLLNKLEEEI